MGLLDVPFRYNAPLWPNPIERREIATGQVVTSVVDLSANPFTSPGYDIGGFRPTICEAWWVESMLLSSNKSCVWNVIGVGLSTVTGIGTYPSANYSAISSAGAITLPIRTWVRGSVSPVIDVRVRQIFDAGLTDCRFAISVSGFAIADDMNFTAPNNILFIGDSIWNGTGPTTKDSFIPWMIRKYYTDKGINCRMVNMSFSGSGSVGHDTFLSRGMYDLPQVSAIFYQLGTNDVAAGTSTGTFQQNVANLIAWKRVKYPGAKLVICGPTPMENNTSEATLATYRTAGAAAVTAAADPKVLYVSLVSSFDRTVAANYVASDSAGNRIHPSDAGIANEWTYVLKPFLDASVPTI